MWFNINVFHQLSKIDNKAAKLFKVLGARFIPVRNLRFSETNKWILERKKKCRYAEPGLKLKPNCKLPIRGKQKPS